MEFKKKIIPIAILSSLSINQIQAATLLSFAQRPLCNVIPTGPHKAILPGHCLRGFSSPTEAYISDAGKKLGVESIAVDPKVDYAVLTVKEKFSKFYETNDVSPKKPIEIVSERGGNKLFEAESTIFEVDPDSSTLAYGFHTIGGDSGAPIIQDGKVVGMHLGVSLETAKVPKRGIALLVNNSAQFNARTLQPGQYDPQWAPLVTAAAWCTANGPACVAGAAAVGAIGAATVNKVGDVIIAYINNRGGSDLLFTKDKLKQCEAAKDEMKKIMDDVYKDNAQNEAFFAVGDEDPIPMSNPGWQSEANDLINKYHGGGGGYYNPGKVTIKEYNIPMHTQTSAGEEAVGALTYLTAIAVVDSYLTAYGKEPTTSEYLAGMNVAWSGKSLADVAYYAKFKIWPKVTVPPRVICEKIFNCDQEM